MSKIDFSKIKVGDEVTVRMRVHARLLSVLRCGYYDDWIKNDEIVSHTPAPPFKVGDKVRGKGENYPTINVLCISGNHFWGTIDGGAPSTFAIRDFEKG